MTLVLFVRLALLVVVACLLPSLVWSQGASTATITGVAKDSSGAVLPGVTVEASSPALIEKIRSTVTDDRGEYRLPELRPGLYTVTFTLPGFATFRRDGLELRTNFTAQIDAEMTVSQLQETITVTGATPLVDTQGATQQRTVSRELLDTVPTAKSVLGIAALIPAVVEPPNAQDVGGSKGERSVRITVHGGKTYDSRLLQDGMRYNALTPGLGSLEGTGRGYYANPLAIQEVVVDLGTMGSAEYLARRRAGEQHSQGRRQPVQRIVLRRRHGRGSPEQQPRRRADQPGADLGQQRREGLRLQRVGGRAGVDGPAVVLRRRAALGDDDGRRQPLCRCERDRLRLHPGPGAADQARREGPRRRRTAHVPGHAQGQVHVLLRQAAELPGPAHRPARNRHRQERGQRRLLPAPRSHPGHVEPAAVQQRPVRRGRDHQQVQLRGLWHRPLPVRL